MKIETMPIILLLFTSIFLFGCTTIPFPGDTVSVKRVQQASHQEKLHLNEEHSFNFRYGRGIGISTHHITLLPGEYVLCATGKGGAFYQHLDKGLRIKNMGLTEYRAGGFIKPYEDGAPWYTWRVPSTSIYTHTGDIGVRIATGATADDAVVFYVPVDGLSEDIKNSPNQLTHSIADSAGSE